MSDVPSSDVGPEPDGEGVAAPVETERARKRRLADAFGDPLPEGTRDDSPEGWGEGDTSARDDEWLRGQVPPHHG